MITPVVDEDKKEFGNMAWLVCDYAEAYNVGQVVTYTYQDIQAPETPDDLFSIIALLVYME